jgi:hypothetical protein
VICLGYLSSASTPPTSEELGQILTTSQANNSAAGITGLLCHYEGNFLQFLEGDANAVITTYARISADPRHGRLIEICRRPIEQRAFGDWTMGVVDPHRMGPAEQAFCRNLKEIQIEAPAEQQRALAPFLDAFRAWIR